MSIPVSRRIYKFFAKKYTCLECTSNSCDLPSRTRGCLHMLYGWKKITRYGKMKEF